MYHVDHLGPITTSKLYKYFVVVDGRIISDRDLVFMSNDFQSYCREENIEHILITTGVRRENGQVERVNHIIIPILTKLFHDYSDK